MVKRALVGVCVTCVCAGISSSNTHAAASVDLSNAFSGTPIVLPGAFHAEDFDNGGQNVSYYDTTPGNSGGAYRDTDVDIEPSSLGGFDVGWIASGEWLNYTANVLTSGTYTLQFQVASPYATGQLHAVIGSTTTGIIAVPNTGGWQNWTTVSTTATLTAGPQILTLAFDGGNFNIAGIAVTQQVLGSTPFTGSPIALPGTFHAENYDIGGQNVAYFDTTIGNYGGAYRGDDVDIQTSSLSGYNIGWIDTGEWLNYTVNPAVVGSYTFTFQVASPLSGGQMHVVAGTAISPLIAIPNSGDWQSWTTVRTTINLLAGPQVLTIYFDSGGFNLAGVTASLPASTSFRSTPAALPGTIAAGDFDNGGEMIGYHDTTSGNEGGAYRETDVDMEASSLGSFDVGWIVAGEWLNYTVNVAATGAYTLQFQVASPNDGGLIHANFNGSPTSTLAVPNTGDWQTWTTLSVPVTLLAGQQVLTVVFDAGGFNFASIGLTPAAPPPPPDVPASYNAVTDRVVSPKPPLPAIGAAGFHFSDPTFGSAMLRVTDANSVSSALGQSYRSPSTGRSWNSDTTRFWVTTTGGASLAFGFNPTTMTATMLPNALPFDTEPSFSLVNPNVLYGGGSQYENPTVVSYDFGTGQSSVVVDLTTLVAGITNPRTYLRDVDTGGRPTEYLSVLFGGQSQDQDRYVLWTPLASLSGRKILDSVASTINGAPTSVPLNFHLHAAGLDESGRYILMTPTAVDQAAPRSAPPGVLWDTATDQITMLTVNANGHGASGWGMGVNHDCCATTSWDAGQWEIRNFATPSRIQDLIVPVLTPQEIFLSDHTSWYNAQANVMVPALAATYRYGTSNTTPWRAWDDEIIAIQTDVAVGTGATVWRFAHHRTDVSQDTNPANLEYWYTPRPNISQNGRWAIFTSNWEKTLGIDPAEGIHRQDVFLVKLQ